MRRKRILLIALTCAILLANCQNGAVPAPTKSTTVANTTQPATLAPLVSPTPAASATPSTPVELTVEPSELQGLEVDFWHPLSGRVAEVLEEQVQDFNRNNPWGIRASARSSGSTAMLDEGIDAAEDEQRPDAVLAPPELLSAWEEDSGMLADLTPYLADPTWGFDPALLSGYDKRFWDQDHHEDQQLGLPALRTLLGLMYNRSFAADLGFEKAPTNMAELRQQACAAAVENNKRVNSYGTGGWLMDTDPLTALSWLSAFGALVEPETWQFDTPEARAALGFLHQLQADGCVWIPKQPIPHTYFSQRLAFLYTASLQDLAPQSGAMTASENSDEWTLIPFPGEDGTGRAYAFGFSYGVREQDHARQMAAWLFVRWMNEDGRLTALAEAWPSLPVHADTRAALEKKGAEFPWREILRLTDAAQPAPTQAAWRTVRRPLEDAFWQVFYLADDEQLDTILPTLDEMTGELLKTQ